MRYSTLLFILISLTAHSQPKVVLIRHAEKPASGFNLTCQGLNRSMQLPAVLYSRFGLPVATYVPSMAFGDNTKHSRMFQTIVPFAAKYNLPLCSKFAEDDTVALAQEVRSKRGTVIIVWEHSRLPAIARCLGITDPTLHWPDKDYDSIWIITYPARARAEAKAGAGAAADADADAGIPRLRKSKEGLHPSTACPY